MGLCVLVAIALGMATAPSAEAQLSTLYTFCSNSGCTDGYNPLGGLVQGTDGNFYGTTQDGGAHGSGTVFKITANGALNTLYSFCSQTNCSDGKFPSAGLVQGSNGNFYGTTESGGANWEGTVFMITPAGGLTTLYSFCSLAGCADGTSPMQSLVQGSDGNLYGTTKSNGANGNGGTIFVIYPGGALSTIYSFCAKTNCADGQTPNSLAQGTDGYLYGTTRNGGAKNQGTVFKITPSGTLTTIYNFCTVGTFPYCTDGASPWAGLMQGQDGNFYGTTVGGGWRDSGIVFKITPTGDLTTLYQFTGYSDAGSSEAPLIQGKDGTLYGTTTGDPAVPGTVFQITPAGALTTLWSFCQQNGCFDGGLPVAPLVMGKDGNLYGTTPSTDLVYWGGGFYGTVFRFALTAYAGISPSSLKFSSQAVGTTSSPQSVTLTNTGSEPLTVSGASVSGDFTVSDNCNAPLSPGQSCQFTVQFAPTATGTRTGKLFITDNNDGVPGSQQIVSLSGLAIAAPPVTLSPTSLTFTPLPVGETSGAQTVTLTNNQSSKLSISGITIAGTYPQAFKEYQTTCGSVLAPKASCKIAVTFKPTIQGTETATVNVYYVGAGSPQTVTLSGQGTGEPQLQCKFWKLVGNGTTTPQQLAVTLTVQNIGTGDATNIQITVVGFPGLDISYVGPNVVLLPSYALKPPISLGNLAAGASTTVTLTFGVPNLQTSFPIWEIYTMKDSTGHPMGPTLLPQQLNP
jgi:uncharacterized repeat protein (TIGR03803 family)